MQKNNNNNNGFGIDRTLLWDDLPGERLRKNIILLLLLLLSLVFIVLVERTPVPEKKEQDDEVPERLARFIQEREEEEPPEPEEPEEQEDEEDQEEEEDEPEEPEEEPETEEEEVEQAREKAREELAVFDEQLSGLRDMAPEQEQDTSNLRRGGSESAEVERDLITSRAGEGSGGVQTGSVSSGGGGGGSLEAGETQEVESSVAEEGEAASETREGKSQRTREQIRRIFDRYGGRMQSAYVRARRQNPALEGTVVLDLEIAPSGKVTDVSVKSSELNAPDLEQKLLVIVQTMDFGEMDVEPWEGDWTLNFFPG